MKEKILKRKNPTSHILPHTSQRGITLIALVITIIVMLILAAVTITMAVNGGLFGYAKNASHETQVARDEEMNWGNGLIGGKTIDELIAGEIRPELNEYGFYFDVPYSMMIEEGKVSIVFKENGAVEAYINKIPVGLFEEDTCDYVSEPGGIIGPFSHEPLKITNNGLSLIVRT